MLRIELNAFPVEGGGFVELAEGEVAAGVIEKVLEVVAQNSDLFSPSSGGGAVVDAGGMPSLFIGG